LRREKGLGGVGFAGSYEGLTYGGKYLSESS